jgi:hypothetical protein
MTCHSKLKTMEFLEKGKSVKLQGDNQVKYPRINVFMVSMWTVELLLM